MQGECVVFAEGEIGMVDTVVVIGEVCRDGGTVQFGMEGGVVNGFEFVSTEEETAVGEAHVQCAVGFGLGDEDGHGFGLCAVELQHFGAGGCEEQGCNDGNYCGLFHFAIGVLFY